MNNFQDMYLDFHIFTFWLDTRC